MADVEEATADGVSKVQDCNIKDGNLDPQVHVFDNKEGEPNQIFGEPDGISFSTNRVSENCGKAS